MHSDEHIRGHIKKIAHIGIAVHSVDQAIPFYTNSLDLKLERIELVQSEEVKVAFLKIGDTRFELLEPLSDSSVIYSFLQKRGEGIHHIALEVENINERVQLLKRDGIRLINDIPTTGANNAQIAFLHPTSTNGVLFELCQPR